MHSDVCHDVDEHHLRTAPSSRFINSPRTRCLTTVQHNAVVEHRYLLPCTSKSCQTPYIHGANKPFDRRSGRTFPSTPDTTSHTAEAQKKSAPNGRNLTKRPADLPCKRTCLREVAYIIVWYTGWHHSLKEWHNSHGNDAYNLLAASDQAKLLHNIQFGVLHWRPREAKQIETAQLSSKTAKDTDRGRASPN